VLIDRSAKVLVTGATGFLGQALVKTLSKHPCSIRLLVRSNTDATERAEELAAKYGAEVVIGELSSAATVLSACKDITHIFHVAAQQAASTQNRPVSKAAIYASNVEATRVLAESAAQAAHPPRFIHVSSAAVHGDTGNQPATESSPFGAKTDYEKSKLEAELLLREIAALSQLPVTIVRPCAIVGPGDKRLLKLFRLANRRLIPILGTGDNRYQIIHVADMANVLVAAAQTKRAIGETYVVGNPETLKLRELIELIAQSAAQGEGIRDRGVGRVLCIPATPVRVVVGYMEKLCAWLGVKPLLSTDRLDFFSANHWFDPSKLTEILLSPMSRENVKTQEGDEAGHSLITHSNASAVADAQRWYEDQRLL